MSMLQRLRETKDVYRTVTGEDLLDLQVTGDEFVAILKECGGFAKVGKGWILVEGVCLFL